MNYDTWTFYKEDIDLGLKLSGSKQVMWYIYSSNYVARVAMLQSIQ